MIDLLSFGQLGFIGFDPSFDPATKLLCIRSIWTTFWRTLCLESLKALNPVRINKPIKSPPCYVYQFHLSTFCITRLQLNCQTPRTDVRARHPKW